MTGPGEDRYRRIFEGVREVCYETDESGIILDISSSITQVLQYGREELIGRSMANLFADDDASREFFDVVRERGSLNDFEAFLVRKDKSTTCCSISARYIHDDPGALSPGIIGSFRDVSRWKRTEKDLRESEELYRALAEESLAGVYIIQDGFFRYINANAADYIGHSREDLIGRKAMDIVHPDDRKKLKAHALAMLKGESEVPYEYRVITRDGQIRWMIETVTSITYKGRSAVLGNSMNTSWTLSRLDIGIVQAIIDAVHDGVYVSDMDGFFVAANKGFERITAISRIELAKKHTNYLIEKKYISEAVNLDVMRDHKSRSKLIRYPSGKEVLVTAAVVWDKNRRPVGLVSTMRDLTELNRMQKKLVHSTLLVEKYKKNLDILSEKLEATRQEFITHTSEGRYVLELAEKVAGSSVTVLITGETGVGKDIIARYIHGRSPRVEKGAFIKVDCAALPANLLESELFGYERGAFTSASGEGKQGLLEAADKGTLFLDEIGELPYELQSKLLNVIQDKEIKRIGGLAVHPVDVRIVAATNRDIEEMVRNKTFRQDLYYRLSVVPIHIPSLRERREDIVPLVLHFLNHFNDLYNANNYIFKDALDYLKDYRWPGNVRELKNMIERFVIVHPDTEIRVADIRAEEANQSKFESSILGRIKMQNRIGSLKNAVRQFEEELIKAALDMHPTLAEAADDLGIDISTLTRKRRKYNLRKNSG
ncbi:MAG: sigma 54-interacting transcriptional regulator [Syntrophales bacterium]|nr:sigma 54-interacting transcriptional regulator [Syntrophales bacterium]MCK9528482.1 sigma 54-interacting transcriptional regulator [Syntrophales bacterium]